MLRCVILVLAMLLAPPAVAKSTQTVTINGVTLNSYCVLLLMNLTDFGPFEEEIYKKDGYVPMDFCQGVQWKWKHGTCRLKDCPDGSERLGGVYFDLVETRGGVTVVVAGYSFGGSGNFSSVAGLALGHRLVGTSVVPVLERRWFREGGDRCEGATTGPWSNGKRVTLWIALTELDLMRAALGKNRLPSNGDVYSCPMCCAGTLDQDIDPITGRETARRYRIEPFFVRSRDASRPDWRLCLVDLLDSEGVLEEIERSQGHSPRYSPEDLTALGERFVRACR
jgi:hypothetical protein